MKSSKDKPLSIKEQRFIKAYIQTTNLAESARRAGYAIGSHGGSREGLAPNKVAHAIGRELIERPRIKKEVNKILVKEQITPESVLLRLDNLADNADKDSDKIQALKLLGQTLKLFGDAIIDKPTKIILSFNMPDSPKITSEVISVQDNSQNE